MLDPCRYCPVLVKMLAGNIVALGNSLPNANDEDIKDVSSIQITDVFAKGDVFKNEVIPGAESR